MWKSAGMMKFPTEWKVIKAMFQTTNQYMVLADLDLKLFFTDFLGNSQIL
jgi:hypothetical protein